jgi:hypothetical protein
MNKSNTFNDFSKLLLGGQQCFLTYTQFVVNNFGSSRAKRRKMLGYYYNNRNQKKIKLFNINKN